MVPTIDRLFHVALPHNSLVFFSALTTAAGVLYMVGQNFHGQCGVGGDAKDPEVVYSPRVVTGFADGERVVHVALGFEHSLAATDR